MILAFLINSFYILIYNVFSILPDSTGLSSDIIDSITVMVEYSHTVDAIFPIETLVDALKYILIFEVGIFSFKIINWVISKVRGSGGT